MSLRRRTIFDANLTYLPQGKKFFAKCHYCEEDTSLYKIGFRSGELYYGIMFSPDKTATCEERQKRKVAFTLGSNVYFISSNSCHEDSLFVYEGNADGTGFINEKSKVLAMKIMEEMDK